MHPEKVEVLLSIAEELFETAQNETLRSNEDVVTHLICNHSRQSILNYLQGFLLKNDIEPASPMTMDALLRQCRQIDARFELADISPINCRFETHDRDYCLDKDQVDRCLDTATQVRNIVMTHTPGF